MARLKTELAKKSEKILALQMDLETVKDELYKVKQRKSTNNHNNNDPFGSGGGVLANPFYPQKAFPMGGSQSGDDDWTDVEDTDNDESDFGESQFGESFFTEKGGEDKVDFW